MDRVDRNRQMSTECQRCRTIKSFLDGIGAAEDGMLVEDPRGFSTEGSPLKRESECNAGNLAGMEKEMGRRGRTMREGQQSRAALPREWGSGVRAEFDEGVVGMKRKSRLITRRGGFGGKFFWFGVLTVSVLRPHSLSFSSHV